MCKRPKFRFQLRIFIPGGLSVPTCSLTRLCCVRGIILSRTDQGRCQNLPVFQSPAPAGTTWLSSQTRATASNFPTHFIWKPAKIGERPYKYVKQEVQITQWCKFPVIDALLKTIKILEKLQCWWMCFPPDAVWRCRAEFGWCIVLFVRILFWISTTSWRPGGGTVGGTKKLGATAILFVGSMVEFCQSV